MAEPIVFVDSSEIREGKLEELKIAIKDLVDFAETNELRPILYHVYLSEDEARMTVVQVHPDSASMEVHVKVAGPVFHTMVDLVAMSSMDICGKPSDELLERMRVKAKMLEAQTVLVHDLHAGFARL